MTFHVGQLVECIDDEWVTEGHDPADIAAVREWPKKGCRYQVRTVERYPGAEAFIRLAEIVNSPRQGRREVEFLALCFRPIIERKTDISIFTSLLNPLAPAPKQREKAKEDA